MENKTEDSLLIVNDLLNEIQDGESNRPKGEGVTTDWYIEYQLMNLADMLNGHPLKDETLESLQVMRNKLNREISKLKKANLKNKCECCGIETSNLTKGACEDCSDKSPEQ